jgi:hypothetical protein
LGSASKKHHLVPPIDRPGLRNLNDGGKKWKDFNLHKEKIKEKNR